ncbi:unnamed protein product, partial [Ectocarpus sp. 13 AM-2016]
MSSVFRRNASRSLFLCISCALLGSCSHFGKGRKQDTLGKRAITCSTSVPVTVSPDSRRRERSSTRRVQFGYLTGGR